VSREETRRDQGGDGDQPRNAGPADRTKLAVLRPEESAQASKCDQCARIGNNFRGRDRSVGAPTLPFPRGGKISSGYLEFGDRLRLLRLDQPRRSPACQLVVEVAQGCASRPLRTAST